MNCFTSPRGLLRVRATLPFALQAAPSGRPARGTEYRFSIGHASVSRGLPVGIASAEQRRNACAAQPKKKSHARPIESRYSVPNAACPNDAAWRAIGSAARLLSDPRGLPKRFKCRSRPGAPMLESPGAPMREPRRTRPDPERVIDTSTGTPAPARAGSRAARRSARVAGHQHAAAHHRSAFG